MAEIIAAHKGPTEPDVTFIHGDYTSPLDLPDGGFELLVSLYAGFISEHCTQHLGVGGTLPKNPQDITVESLHASCRGVGYTTSPFAYLFTRTE